MKFLGLFKNSQVFKIALGIAILVVLYIGSVFYSELKSLNVSYELIKNSTNTQLELENIVSVISKYENNIRAYIIFDDDSYLDKEFNAQEKVNLSLIKLDRFVAGDPEEIDNIEKLKVLMHQRFELFREVLQLSKGDKKNNKELNVKLKESISFSESLKDLINENINTERDKVTIYNESHQFKLEDSIISAFLLVILSLLILLLSFNKTNVDISELQIANDELLYLNDSFNKAEKIAGFGHWKVNVDTGEYSFSDNFFRLLGESPNSFEATVENHLKYIHPEDREFVLKTHVDSLKTQSPTSIVYRYLLPSGEIRYINTVGSFTKNSKGESIKTGVNNDITDQHKKTLELEENNKELKNINEELQSFNNIVSHDLQEPLRKIQMFISRIEEKELNSLSQQGIDYLTKVRVAANRMQALLVDLVNYSRTVKGDKVFVELDLNEICSEMVEDLSVNVEEKKAIIDIGNLPTIKAIPFQIRQLFINLVSNSLKYSKEDVIPHIKISSEQVTQKDMLEHKIANESDYHKIVIVDNGIGFKQEYAEKVFMLFKRLETDPKYKGTGLGLAICNRIVDNHKGFIRVKSKPNNGAKFYIFLPQGDWA